MPAIKSIKEDLPYFVQDFSIISAKSVTQLKDGDSLIPSSASIRKATLKVESEGVLEYVATSLKRKAEKCSYDNLIPRSSGLPSCVIDGNECVHEHLNFTYKFNDDGTAGELYYIPFVYVVYSYKEDTYAWGFVISPKYCGAYDVPNGVSNTVEDELDNQSEEFAQVKSKWNGFILLFGILSCVIGVIIFLLFNYSLYERIERRYKSQQWMTRLRSIYKRRENLVKRGADKKTLAEINADIQEEFEDDEENDSVDEITPKSIREIDEYYATTNVLKRKLLKRMKLFWVYYIALIVIVAGAIIGYNRWDDIQKEKMWKEEQAMIEAENKKLTDEVTEKFNAEIVGNTYEGYDLYEGKHMKLKFLDGSRLQYQLGMENGEWDFTNGARKIVNWEQPKTVTYRLSINRHEKEWHTKAAATCRLEFDGYTSENILKEYGELEFVNEIIIPLKNNESYSTNAQYYLKKK